MATFIGIDPGATGATCVLVEGENEEPERVTFFDGVTCPPELQTEIKAAKLVILEEVHSMPKQGVRSMFTFGRNVGFWEGALHVLKARWETARPQDWQKAVLDGHAKRIKNDKGRVDSKKAAKDWVSRLFPFAPIRGPKGGVKDGRVDALCLAVFARMRTRGGD